MSLSLCRHARIVALALSGITAACADTTSPLAPQVEQSAAQLPSLTWQGANGSRTATLVGTNLVLENGTRIAIDAATASNFRRLAVSMPKMEALAQRMEPVWSKMGLPAPTSEVQARVAVAALRSRTASTSSLDGVLALTSPIVKPTLVADCDPQWQFCGFDTGDPNLGGGTGGSGGSGSGSAGGCQIAGLMLYQAIAEWRAAVLFFDQAVSAQNACVQNFGPAWPSMCWLESSRLSLAGTLLVVSTLQMEAYGQALRAMGCV